MTNAGLSFGSFLIAFSPTLSLLISIISQKPQLVILAITAAFAYLLSALLSSLFWLPVPNSIQTGNGMATLLSLVIPGVTCQMIVRCFFVKVYFRVEGVIRRSVQRHEDETAAANANSNANRGGGDNQQQQQQQLQQQHAETNALQLQLNDISCALASGCGYALLHSLFLYGTLLASESGESSYGGTLYQPSCSTVPSLIHGALIACLFSILDVVWIMLTFYGMRRRAMYGNQRGVVLAGSSGGIIRQWQQPLLEGLSFPVKGLSDSLAGGNAALGLVAISHLVASLVLAPNGMMEQDGCQVSLPCLGVVVLLVTVFFVRGVKGHYLPEDQRRRIRGLMMMGEGGNENVSDGYHAD